MGTERRRQLILAALAIVLAVVAYQAWPRTSAQTPPSSNPRAGASTAPSGASGQASTEEPEGPDVHLEALGAERPKPEGHDRNLFRFKPKAPPPQAVVAPVPVPVPVPTGPPPPPPVAPINLKFLGVLERENKPKMAILSDGTGATPFYGMEGEIVAGRYRILKIGVESIEMAYLDGRGRQTIRLNGS
jgi:hypothetical protein